MTSANTDMLSEDDRVEEAYEVDDSHSLIDYNRSASSSNVNSDLYSKIDLENLGLNSIPAQYLSDSLNYSPRWVRHLSLRGNNFHPYSLTDAFVSFRDLVFLDLSNNILSDLPHQLSCLSHLKILIVKNNRLESDSLPKNFGASMKNLEVLNLSGNQIAEFPSSILEFRVLKFLHMGGNRLNNIPCAIGDVISLETLYLGGNQLTDIPATVGKLKNLTSLTLSDNHLETIPSTLVHLRKLMCLNLHNNRLKTLPVELIKLRNLDQLSLRGNPLVVRFVRDMAFNPPSLKELAGRTIKTGRISYSSNVIPVCLIKYLDSAHHCVNQKCKGVYFDTRIEHVKFVDFCGKYRVPFLQYLCSPACSSFPAFSSDSFSSSSSTELDGSDADADDFVPPSKMKKVLLG